MLVDETRRIVDLIVDHEKEVLLGSMLRDVGVGEFFVSHSTGGNVNVLLFGSVGEEVQQGRSVRAAGGLTGGFARVNAQYWCR